MAKIDQVTGFEIIDSRRQSAGRGRSVLADGARGFGAALSGASTGSREALELRDGDRSAISAKG
jgi:enolase